MYACGVCMSVCEIANHHTTRRHRKHSVGVLYCVSSQPRVRASIQPEINLLGSGLRWGVQSRNGCHTGRQAGELHLKAIRVECMVLGCAGAAAAATAVAHGIRFG